MSLKVSVVDYAKDKKKEMIFYAVSSILGLVCAYGFSNQDEAYKFFVVFLLIMIMVTLMRVDERLK